MHLPLPARSRSPPACPGLPCPPCLLQAELAHVGQELSDVLLYLLRLADVCGVDLGRAALAKLADNAAR